MEDEANKGERRKEWWETRVTSNDVSGSSGSGSFGAVYEPGMGVPSKQANPFASASSATTSNVQSSDASKFSLFFVPRASSSHSTTGLSRSAESEDENVSSCRRRLKRLKSLDLPIELTKELLASLSKPKTNTSMFGCHIRTERSLYEFGVCASQGPRIHMEDRYCVVGSFWTEPYATLFALFDGHGGSSAAEFCSHNLYQNLHNAITKNGFNEIGRCFLEAFQETDNQLRTSPQHLAGREGLVGTTAVAVVLTQTDCFVANVGDSRALLVQEHTLETTQLTHDHKPNIEVERRRIEAAGGRISEDNRVEGILSMSRALGDSLLKQFVIATPQVTVRKLSHEDHFIILGTDGLYDFVNNTNVSSIAKYTNTPQEAAESLVAAAMNARSNDNVSALVIDLRKRKDESSLKALAMQADLQESDTGKERGEEEEDDTPTLVLPSRPPGKRPNLRLEL